MTEQEAIAIALDFWLKRKNKPVVRTTTHFREDKNEWRVIFRTNPNNDEDFVVIIVDVESKKASFFPLL